MDIPFITALHLGTLTDVLLANALAMVRLASSGAA